jgi:hypothetical protein
MKTLPYNLLEPHDTLAVGDVFVRVEAGNKPVKIVCDPSWSGAQVKDCPEGLYLRPLKAKPPAPPS